MKLRALIIIFFLLVPVLASAQLELRQSTARTLIYGPFMDDTDGNTIEDGLTITQAEVRLSKNGGNYAQKSESTSLVHDELGQYTCLLDATDTATLGLLRVSVHEGGSLQVWQDFVIVTSNYWDSKYSTDKLEVDLLQMVGTAQSATDLKDFADAGYTPGTNSVLLVDTVTTNTDQVGTDSALLAASAPTNWSSLTIDATGTVSSDAIQVSGDYVAANNLELQYDTTGLTGQTFPASQAQADRNAALTESQRGRHTWSGNVYYVDPVNGDTHANGNRGGKDDPYKTIQDCHDNAVTDSNHDVIILVPGAAAGVTTHTIAGTTTLSKRYLFIRGPGRDFIITRTGSGDTIAITADGVEISGVQIGTAASGSGDGIDITDADFTSIHDCWFLDTQGDGIHVLRGDNGQYLRNNFEGTGVGGSGQGIHIVGTAGDSNANQIRWSHFSNTAGDSILIEQGTTNDTTIACNQIHDASGWAINIGGSSNAALVHNNFFGNNTSGDITDAGATTVQANNEQWAKHSIATEARLVELDAANLPSDIDAILTDVTGINGDAMRGTDSALLASASGAIPWNASWDTEVQSEVNDALVAQKLDHLVAVADADDPVDDSLIAKIGSTDGDWSNFSETTEALQSIRDRGDAAWAPSGVAVNATVTAMAANTITGSALATSALAEFVTVDTGETVATAGSVAKIAQGSAGGNVTVGAFTVASLIQMVTEDTGLSAATVGSVALIAQGTALSGTGTTVVNHDTGGADELTYESSPGVGISGASVKAYVKTDYDADVLTIRGQTITNDSGEWVNPLYLDSGTPYSIRFELPGQYGPDISDVTP